MFLAIAHLPNTGIRKLPVLTYPLKTLTDLYPNIVRSGADVLVRQIKGVHEFAVDVSLELRNRCITNEYRPGTPTQFPVISRLLRKFVVTLNRKDDRAGPVRIRLLGRIFGDPAHKVTSLVSESISQKCTS